MSPAGGGEMVPGVPRSLARFAYTVVVCLWHVVVATHVGVQIV
jgi:hypothetical protein